MSAPEDAGDAPEGWMPSTTAGRVFFQLPTSPKGFGRVVGVDGVSSMGTEQTGMRQISYAVAVRAAAPHILSPACLRQ